MMTPENTHQSPTPRFFPSSPRRRFFTLITLLLLALLLAGCGAQTVTETLVPTAGPPITESQLIDDLDEYVAPTPEAKSEETDEEPMKDLVAVTTEGARANLRSAPMLDSEIIGKGNPDSIWEVVSQSEDGAWYQVCCTQGLNDAEGQPTTPAWVASSVVTPTTGVADYTTASVDISDPVLTDGLESTWEVEWSCGSDRCAVSECKATVTATADTPNQQYLLVEHDLTWEDECFPDDNWIFEVDRYSGTERTGDFVNNFLYSYWVGGEPGEANGVYRYDDETGIAVWCSEPSDVEIEEGDGWTSIYQGSTCHDVKTGALVLLEYKKRWLYSGEYDGTTYNRSYFGDSETLQQRLVDTNIEMAFMESKEE